jgi:hypothetical protein
MVRTFTKSTLWFLFSFQAKEAIAEVEQKDPTHVFTRYYIFKIAIMEGDAFRGINVLYALMLTIKNPQRIKSPQ